jgi:ABC-2 type transport system permease protein
MNILRIALNDVRVVLKDKLIIVWWLAMPLAFVFMFSFMARDNSNDRTWLAVVKYDDHELADVFVDQLRRDKFRVDVKSPEDEHWVDDWSQAVVIPEGFSSEVLKGERVDLTLTKGKGNAERFLAVQTSLVRSLIRFNTAVASIDLVEKGWSQQSSDELVAELNREQQLSVANMGHNSLRPPPSGYASTLPAYLVMFVMMMTVMYGGITLVYERAERRINRLAACPVSLVEIFLGKMLARMVQPVMQGTILIFAGVTIFRVELGDHPTALIPVILSFAFFCGAIGLLCGVLFKTEQQVMATGIVVTMALSALGGCWWTLEVVPQTFKTIALFTPSYWALQGIYDVMVFGKSWADVVPKCAVLVGFGVVFTAIAIPLFHRD